MPKFKYSATDPEGNSISGSIDAENIARARGEILSKGLEIQRLKERTGLNIQIAPKRVKPIEVMHFSRQLAAFIRAGVPILEGFETIAEETDNQTLQTILFKVADDVRGGASLSSAMIENPKMFPRYYIDMVKAAELTGNLDQVLDQLADYMERDIEARQKIRSALVYPVLVLVLAMVTITIMTAFVLPRFEVFFRSLRVELPLPTRMLIWFSGFVSTWWWAMIGVGAALVIATFLAAKSTGGKRLLDRLVLGIPVVGGTVRYAIIERFCRILSAMVSAGVPLPDAMAVVTEGTNNSVFQSKLVGVRDSMIEGEGIVRPIARTGVFPPTVIQMIRVGEETGTLDEQLDTAAKFYDRELTYRIKRVTTLFEPAAIIVAGVIVGFVAVAIVSAMYGVFRQVRVF